MDGVDFVVGCFGGVGDVLRELGLSSRQYL